MAIGSITRHSHQLIAHHPSPRLSSRFVVPPGSPPCRPVPSSSLVSLYRPAWFVSSCRPIIRFACRFLSSSRRGLSHSWRRIGSGGRATGMVDGLFMRRFTQLIIVRPVIRFSSSGRRMIVVGPTGRFRREFLTRYARLIRLIHLTSPPFPRLIMERGEAWVPVIFQASNDITASIPSWRVILGSSSHPHHLIPSPS